MAYPGDSSPQPVETLPVEGPDASDGAARPHRILYTAVFLAIAVFLVGHRQQFLTLYAAAALAALPQLLMFVVAGRVMGITIEHFGYGFGAPVIRLTVGWLQIRLNWVPMGGYVKFVRESNLPGSYESKPAWMKVVHPLTGPGVLLVIGLVMLGPEKWLHVWRHDWWGWLTLWWPGHGDEAREMVLGAYRFADRESFGIIFARVATLLGCTNLTPLPIGNGGMSVMALVEGLLCRPIRPRTRNLIEIAGLLILLLLAGYWGWITFSVRTMPL